MLPERTASVFSRVSSRQTGVNQKDLVDCSVIDHYLRGIYAEPLDRGDAKPEEYFNTPKIALATEFTRCDAVYCKFWINPLDASARYFRILDQCMTVPPR